MKLLSKLLLLVVCLLLLITKINENSTVFAAGSCPADQIPVGPVTVKINTSFGQDGLASQLGITEVAFGIWVEDSENPNLPGSIKWNTFPIVTAFSGFTFCVEDSGLPGNPSYGNLIRASLYSGRVPSDPNVNFKASLYIPNTSNLDFTPWILAPASQLPQTKNKTDNNSSFGTVTYSIDGSQPFAVPTLTHANKVKKGDPLPVSIALDQSSKVRSALYSITIGPTGNPVGAQEMFKIQCKPNSVGQTPAVDQCNILNSGSTYLTAPAILSVDPTTGLKVNFTIDTTKINDPVANVFDITVKSQAPSKTSPFSFDVKSEVGLTISPNPIATKETVNKTFTVALSNFATDRYTIFFRDTRYLAYRTTLSCNPPNPCAGTIKIDRNGLPPGGYELNVVNNANEIKNTGTLLTVSGTSADSPTGGLPKFCKPKVLPNGSPNPDFVAGTDDECSSASGKTCDVSGPNSNDGVLTAIGCIPTDPNKFINSFMRVAAFAGGGIALLLMIFGAVQMVASAGNPETLKKGQETFTAAIIGLLFIIFATLLLQIIGVDILSLPGFGR